MEKLILVSKENFRDFAIFEYKEEKYYLDEEYYINLFISASPSKDLKLENLLAKEVNSLRREFLESLKE